ncbi:MAG TPA: AAA domain-containing protein, partial [Acidimicrobiia bacterium]|nr:AAA domain-containing protein [Acidimicrobiia bacterium]
MNEPDAARAAAPEVDEARAARVRRVSAQWQRELVDLSGRNRLLYYRDQKLGTIDLGAAQAPADPIAVDQLLDGRPVALSQLFRPTEPAPAPDADDDRRTAGPATDPGADPGTDPDRGRAALARQARRARTIAAKADEMFEERGIRTLFLGVGMARWTEQQSAAQPAAPVVLFPLAMRPRGASAEDFELAVIGDPGVSATLLEKLATDFGLRAPVAELDDLLLAGDNGADNGADDGADDGADGGLVGGWPIADVFDRLIKEAGGHVPGFAIGERLVIGNFAYHKLPMVKDLEANEDHLIAHDLVAAIAGDETARAAVAASDGAVEVDPALPDLQPPADEFLVVDADGTQSYAINSVLGGSNLVVKGPPGTGKSQTIANLIATLAARRQRVLFVAEKRAAIDAVLKRLDAEGLGHLVMDLHHRAQSRRLIAQDLQAALDAAATTPAVDLAAAQAGLVARRDRLNRYTDALHRRRDPWGVTLYDALQTFAGTDAAARLDYRFPTPALATLDADRATQAAQALRDFVGLGGFPAPDDPWAGARLTTTDEVRAALDAVTRLRAELPGWRNKITRVSAAGGLRPPTTATGVQSLATLLDGVHLTLRWATESLFSFDLAQAAKDLDRGPLGRLLSVRYRRARKLVGGVWRDRDPSPHELAGIVAAARDQAAYWARVSADGVRPRGVTGVDSLERRTAAVGDALGVLANVIPDVAWSQLDLDDLAGRVDALAATHDVAVRLPETHHLWAEIGQLQVEGCYRACAAAGVPGRLVETAFRHCWLASIYDHELIGEPDLVALRAEFHDEVVDEFRRADETHIDSGAARVRRVVAEWIVETRNELGEQSALVAREAAKARRHLPLRRLFAEAPDMLTTLKPCWAMSPLEVSQLLPGDRQYFDVVVFDEASQVTPADAIPSILRGRRVVVAGDQQQLPPTAFFVETDDSGAPIDEYTDDGTDGPLAGALDRGTAGFEAILDVLGAILPARTLGWHYRSRDERLIAFSNTYFYDRSLHTFPGVHGGDCLRHIRVPAPRPGLDAEASAAAEVVAVIDAILEHASTRPDETLGVIALGITHANRITEALRRARLERPELDGFFDRSTEGDDEPFFVKNLERVQGDERDAIILSVGYGKRNADGRLTYHFGPIITEKGERRLNVAITRARRRLTLVSTFGAEDMDPARSDRRGVELLRRYLAYVASGGDDLGSGPAENPQLNAFEIDVRDRLAAAGVPVL